MKKYLATFKTIPTIEEIEVERETNDYVYTKVGQSEFRTAKTSNHKNVRNTYPEAVERLYELFREERASIIKRYEIQMKSSVELEKQLANLV